MTPLPVNPTVYLLIGSKRIEVATNVAPAQDMKLCVFLDETQFDKVAGGQPFHSSLKENNVKNPLISELVEDKGFNV